MSTELHSPWSSDSPWDRLPWTLPAAVIICAMALWALAYVMERPAPEQMAPAQIEAQFLEEPPPAPPHGEAPRPLPWPEPVPVPKAPPKREHVEKKGQPQEAAPTPNIALPAAPKEEEVKPGLDQAGTVSGPVSSGVSTGPSGPALPGNGPTGSGGKGMAGSPSGVETTLPDFGAAYLHNPKPAYPPLARKMGIEGKVVLKAFVSKEGNPLRIEVAESSGHDVLDKAAFDAVKNWRFVPARKGDAPYDEWVQVPIAFRLKK